MVEEIRKLLGTKNLLIGTERTMKALRKGQLEKIFMASNADQKTKKDIEYYSQISSVQVENLNETNEELGIICKKSFSISVIGLLK